MKAPGLRTRGRHRLDLCVYGKFITKTHTFVKRQARAKSKLDKTNPLWTNDRIVNWNDEKETWKMAIMITKTYKLWIYRCFVEQPTPQFCIHFSVLYFAVELVAILFWGIRCDWNVTAKARDCFQSITMEELCLNFFRRKSSIIVNLEFRRKIYCRRKTFRRDLNLSEHFSFDHNLILHKTLSHVKAIRAVTIGSLAQRIWICSIFPKLTKIANGSDFLVFTSLAILANGVCR